MKRILVAFALLTVAAFTLPALALPGPDPVTGPFSISITNADPSSSASGQVVERLEFNRSFPGFDFGDREGYRCAYVELFNAQRQVLATYTFEVFRPAVTGTASAWAKINDKNGPDNNDNDPNTGPDDYCGVSGPAATYNGEDHFPHMIHAGDGITFSNGFSIPLANTACDRFYFTPGNDPAEVIAWWDEDGPTGSHDHGTNDLNCSGGLEEPIPVLRGTVQIRAAGQSSSLVVCAHSMHEDRCTGTPQVATTTVPPTTTVPLTTTTTVTPLPTAVTLGPGTSQLSCPNGSNPVVTQTSPLRVTC